MDGTLPDTSAKPARASFFAVAMGGGLVGLVLSISAAISLGAIGVPASTVWGVLANKLVPDMVPVTWSAGREAVEWDIR